MKKKEPIRFYDTSALLGGAQIAENTYISSIVLDEAELFDIAVDLSYQGKGLSKILMEHFMNICKEKQVRTIFLEVNTNNIKAINLYTKFGFVEYSRRKNYYGDNDAILMKLDV